MHLARPDSTCPARRLRAVAAAMAAIALGSAQAADPHMVKAVKHTEDTHGAAAAPSKAVVEAPTKVAAPGATPGAALADPLEVLRQRLAGKLTGTKSSEGANSLELRLNSKPPVLADSAAPHKAAPARKSAAHGAAAAPAHGAGGAHAHWSYQGAAGPQTWGGL